MQVPGIRELRVVRRVVIWLQVKVFFREFYVWIVCQGLDDLVFRAGGDRDDVHVYAGDAARRVCALRAKELFEAPV